jgi:hypothetical protein
MKICLLLTYLRTIWESTIDEIINAAILVLSEKLRETLRERGGNVVARVETGLLVGNHLGHQTFCFMNYLLKIRENIENT